MTLVLPNLTDRGFRTLGLTNVNINNLVHTTIWYFVFDIENLKIIFIFNAHALLKPCTSLILLLINSLPFIHFLSLILNLKYSSSFNNYENLEKKY